MRTPGNTERISLPQVQPVCSGCGRIMVDGVPCDIVDPGCIVHGLEAKLKAHAPYYAESNPRDNDVEGRE